MADIDLKTETPDTTLPTTGFLFGADSQAAASPSVYSTQTVATTLLGSTTLTGATVTTSQPVIDASQTWNDGGANVTFTGLKFNATDTASASGSLLMDLQVGGASQLQITKAGRINGPTGGNLNLNGAIEVFASQVRIGANNPLQWFTDTILTRRAAANLRLGAADTTGTTAPTAQTLSVQSWASSTNNNQPGADFRIDGSQGTGTGAGGSIIFRVAPAGGVANGVQNALSTALTINSAQQVVMPASPAATTPRYCFDNGTSGFGFISNALRCVINGSLAASVSATVLQLVDSSASIYLGSDVVFTRDAANTLALRNGTNAQAFRVYNTFTSATDFERANIFWDSNVLKIGTEKGSAGGTARALEFQTDGTTRLTIGTTGVVTIASAVSNPFQVISGTSGFYGPLIQNTGSTTTSSAGFTVQNNQTSQLFARVYGSGVSASVWGITLSSFSALFSDGASSEGLLIGTLTTDPIIFGTDTSEKMRITSAGLITFGGTTSSFPALKRSTTSLQAVLADDTGFTNIQGKLTTDTAYTAGAPTATGYIVLYDSTGTAYKIPAEAL